MVSPSFFCAQWPGDRQLSRDVTMCYRSTLEKEALDSNHFQSLESCGKTNNLLLVTRILFAYWSIAAEMHSARTSLSICLNGTIENLCYAVVFSSKWMRLNLDFAVVCLFQKLPNAIANFCGKNHKHATATSFIFWNIEFTQFTSRSITSSSIHECCEYHNVPHFILGDRHTRSKGVESLWLVT